MISMFRRNLISSYSKKEIPLPPTINAIDSKAGDICLYDRSRKNLLIIKIDTLSDQISTSNYIPVGIVVIPGSHNIYGDNSCSIMSLLPMSCDTPNSGTSGMSRFFPWGGENTSSLSVFNQVPSVGGYGYIEENVSLIKDYAYLPTNSDWVNRAVDNTFDPETWYSNADDFYSPSPYNINGEFNTEYSRTAEPSDITNALSDFKGKENTDAIVKLETFQVNWKTDETITSSYDNGHFPAACCCWRYHTEGTKQGDWYLPAMGELGYLMVRLGSIYNSVNKLNSVYGKGTAMFPTDASQILYTSTKNSNYDVRTINLMDGLTSYTSNSSNYNTAFAFFRFK